MAIKLATPGVYIEEKNAFPSSVPALSTAVPAFIGYTQKTSRKGQSLVNKPVRLSSLAEYQDIFGTGALTTYQIETSTADEYDVQVAGEYYQVTPSSSSRFIMYEAIRLFFANGGGVCWIVSTGGFNDKISKKALETGIATLTSEVEPTLVVVPEAVMLEDKGECFAVQQAMLMHCGQKMKNRFAIIDVYDGFEKRTYDETDVITQFREGVGNNFLNFGAAYYPWILTAIVENDEISYKNIANLDVLTEVLSKEADTIASGKRAEEMKNEIKKLTDADADSNTVHQTLTTICPSFKVFMQKVKMLANILPPSAGMAGVYSTVDNSRGVWKAPANVGFNSAVSPTVKITHEDQEDLNVTISGKSVNAIRAFVGQGILVWGARTLDGNSQDWKYVNVRRTMLFIEESIKNAARPYVYEPNTSTTWSLMRSMISSFLTDLYNQGGLVGATAEQSYEVLLGLGQTMTPEDILEGILRITVKVAISRPAEFIVITFQQKMQEG